MLRADSSTHQIPYPLAMLQVVDFIYNLLIISIGFEPDMFFDILIVIATRKMLVSCCVTSRPRVSVAKHKIKQMN